MKYLVLAVTLILIGISGFSQVNTIQTDSQLGIKYYNSRDFEKAAPLVYKAYKSSNNSYYLKLYLNCLTQLKDFEEAEKVIKQAIKQSKTPNPEFYIHWGHILKSQKQIEEGNKKFEQALKIIPQNKANYLNTANTFLQWAEYEMAEKTYLLGREKLKNENFHFELARAYMYLRNHEKMMEEYLDYVKSDEKFMATVQSSISSVLRNDIGNELRTKFKKMTLKRVQAEPNIIAFNRLLIWFFLQERKFSNALKQSIALDKRTGNEDGYISNLANIAANNRNYPEAQNAFQYILDKGKENPFYLSSYIQSLQTRYYQFIQEESSDKEAGQKLANDFTKGFEYIGFTPLSYQLVIQNAHLLGFYLDRVDEAINLLNRGLKINILKPIEKGEIKTELADLYIYSGDPWEATILYSQVIEANKNNTLGNQVKLKKAKLGYYIGNFNWAQAQLDVLKASTSKLTANDAFELSLLIGNNLNLDTTEVPLQLFANADLLFFRNKDSLALATLDSIRELFPYHSLIDDILYRKAKIEIRNTNYKLASDYLKQIIDEFAYDLLADDALYLQAEIHNYYLNEPVVAMDLYKQLMLEHPGSIYVIEARKKFRELRGDDIKQDEETEDEDQFFEGI